MGDPSAMYEEGPLAEHEPVILRRRAGDSLLLPLERGPRTIEGHGVLDLSDQIGRAPGGVVAWAGAQYRLYRPSLSDLLAHLRRRAQIVTQGRPPAGVPRRDRSGEP